MLKPKSSSYSQWPLRAAAIAGCLGGGLGSLGATPAHALNFVKQGGPEYKALLKEISLGRGGFDTDYFYDKAAKKIRLAIVSSPVGDSAPSDEAPANDGIEITDLIGFGKDARVATGQKLVYSGGKTILGTWGLLTGSGYPALWDRIAEIKTNLKEFAEEAKEGYYDDPEFYDLEKPIYSEWASDTTLLSAVGLIASTRHIDSYYGQGAAHPDGGFSIAATNFTTGKPVSLDQVATANSILEALKADPKIKKIAKDSDVAEKLVAAKTLDEATTALDGAESECQRFSKERTLQHFSFEGYDKAKNLAKVRIYFAGYGACRALLTAAHLSVTPTSTTHAALVKVAAGKEGKFDTSEEDEDAGFEGN